MIDRSFRLAGGKATCILADKIMQYGFKYSTEAGISICLDDMTIPKTKNSLILQTEAQVTEFRRQYDEGLITDGERYNKVVDLWAQTADKVAKDMMSGIETQEFDVNGQKVKSQSFNAIHVSWLILEPGVLRHRFVS
jgi:DNA-directed RNA polymerase subunit beta'